MNIVFFGRIYMSFLFRFDARALKTGKASTHWSVEERVLLCRECFFFGEEPCGHWPQGASTRCRRRSSSSLLRRDRPSAFHGRTLHQSLTVSTCSRAWDSSSPPLLKASRIIQVCTSLDIMKVRCIFLSSSISWKCWTLRIPACRYASYSVFFLSFASR